jgi:type IV secretory pathway protease TraF
MLGDNRGESDDSRFWGPIPASWIVGVVTACYTPRALRVTLNRCNLPKRHT